MPGVPTPKQDQLPGNGTCPDHYHLATVCCAQFRRPVSNVDLKGQGQRTKTNSIKAACESDTTLLCVLFLPLDQEASLRRTHSEPKNDFDDVATTIAFHSFIRPTSDIYKTLHAVYSHRYLDSLFILPLLRLGFVVESCFPADDEISFFATFVDL